MKVPIINGEEGEVNIKHIAATCYTIISAGVAVFQIALAVGAPWGGYAMGGAFPGQFRYAHRCRRTSCAHDTHVGSGPISIRSCLACVVANVPVARMAHRCDRSSKPRNEHCDAKFE